jgi:hypothetical protein
MYSPADLPSRLRAAPAKKRRFADVRRLDLRELLGVVLEDLRELVQQLRALLRRCVEPAGQRLLRALDDRVDFVGRHVRHGADRLGRCGVDDVDRGHGFLLFDAEDPALAG